MSTKREIRDKILHNKDVRTYSDDELKFLGTPTGFALFNHKVALKQIRHTGENRTHWSDKVECKICGKMYTRSNLTAHNGSKFHRKAEEDRLIEMVAANSKILLRNQISQN